MDLNKSLKCLGYSRFTILDTESTGFSPNVYSKLIQVSAVKMVDGVIEGEFDRYINPHLKTKQVKGEIIYTGEPGIPKKIRELTGIDDDVIKAEEAKGVSTEENDVILDFWEFVQGTVLVMHNAPHDLAFLDAAGKGVGVVFTSLPVVDTYPLAKKVWPERQGKGAFKLETLCKDLGISDENHHNALNDCRATAELFKRVQLTLVKEPVKWEELTGYQEHAEENFQITRVAPWQTRDGRMHRLYCTLWDDKETATVFYDFDRKRWDQKDGTVKVYQFEKLKEQIMGMLTMSEWTFAEADRRAGKRAY